ncbi:acyltransferase family protein [Leifsonia sp. McL0607]|uniref:acyltransferase family protein n=1 Tax=Leifsonia sp. McL0607 TaxID=3415672 RepID=UPI003CE7DD5E
MTATVSVSTPTSTRGHFRADIEGLRSVAVLLVVGSHLIVWPEGGFVGVDVFFVISGYLITGILIRQLEVKGTISFVDFYRRRFLRIVPAALVVLILTTAVTWLVFFPVRALATTWDAVFAAVFVENWNLVSRGTQYFASTSVPSPFQHYWSLSVEEQFYLLWPWLLILAAALFRTRHARRRALVVGLVAGVAVSFVLACIESELRPSIAYFSTATRAWELGIGALVALLPKTISARLGDRAHAVVWLTGLGLIVVSAFVITESAAFPGPWAAFPVAGTAAILFSDRPGRWQIAVTNPVARYFGKISYSLYLWHWPVIVFLIILSPSPATWQLALSFALMVALSAISYHFVETPFRHWRLGSASADRVFASAKRPKRMRRPLRWDRGLGAGLALILVVACVLPWAPRPTIVSPPSDPASAAPPFRTSEQLASALTAATRSASWPDLSPPIGSLTRADSSLELASQNGCISGTGGDVVATVQRMSEHCVLGDATSSRTAVVLGDSIAASWLPALESALPGWRIVAMTFQSCPAVDVTVDEASGRRAFRSECDAARDAAVSRAIALHPDLVLLSSALGSFERQVGSADPGDAWRTGTVEAIRALADVPRTLVVESPPEGPSPADCALRILSPVTCEMTPSADWEAKSTAEADGVRAAAAEGAGVEFISTRAWFCTPSGVCPIFAAGTPIRVDRGHLTAEYTQRLSVVLAAAVRP